MNRRQCLAVCGTAVTGVAGISGTAVAQSAGSIRVVSEPSGEYSVGETVPVQVEVTNEGSDPNTMYVGYSTSGPDGDLYNNGKDTDEATDHLAPGETQTLTVEWEVTNEAPPGYYGYVVKLWDERRNDGAPDEELYNELDGVDETDRNVFEVV